MSCHCHGGPNCCMNRCRMVCHHCWHSTHIGAWYGVNPPPMFCCICGIQSSISQYTITWGNSTTISVTPTTSGGCTWTNTPGTITGGTWVNTSGASFNVSYPTGSL